jgi:UDP-N-acetylglucosamine--N-acetylmuramyl-(pentapeptide) pyrophosphoryl-undecaprenol N-acetylglucosamine transferase
MQNNDNLSILVAAGGTGGHLYPALAVIEELELACDKKLEVIFVGNPNKIESKVVPALGYDFYGMPITGLTSLFSISTLSLPYKILKSKAICRSLIKKYRPKAVLCTGAYISYPAGVAAIEAKIPLILMESNVSPGKTIQLLSRKASAIITSFEETCELFPPGLRDKIFCFGNPVRRQILSLPSQTSAKELLGLDPDLKTLLIFGGSLGSRSINEAVEKILNNLSLLNVQILWQTGFNYTPDEEYFESPEKYPNLKAFRFIDDMASVYSAADLIISRAGATTVAELAASGKPSILIPLPSASNNEQALNAEQLENQGAAIVINDSDLDTQLEKVIFELINDQNRLETMHNETVKLAKPMAAEKIAEKIIELTS